MNVGSYLPVDPQSAISAVNEFATESGIKKKIASGFDELMKGMPIFMDALDRMGTVHPVVQGLVLHNLPRPVTHTAL